jgi:AcrR family transcriptional regulator
MVASRGSPKRKPGRPVDRTLAARRRSDLLAAAAGAFARRGFDRTEVDEIAEEAGVSKGTVYRYFPSKEALFLASVDGGMRALTASVNAAAARAADPLERMAAAIRAYLAFFDANPHFVELLMIERAVFRDRKKPTYFEHRDENIGEWRELIQGLIDAGRVRGVPVERITDGLSHILYGTIFTNAFAGRTKPLEVQANDVIDFCWRGILAVDGPARSPRGRA